jgi:hypothetical protein
MYCYNLLKIYIPSYLWNMKLLYLLWSILKYRSSINLYSKLLYIFLCAYNTRLRMNINAFKQTKARHKINKDKRVHLYKQTNNKLQHKQTRLFKILEPKRPYFECSTNSSPNIRRNSPSKHLKKTTRRGNKNLLHTSVNGSIFFKGMSKV